MPIAVLTGTNSGIGHAFATLLLQENYKVYALDKTVGDKLISLEKSGVVVAEVDVTSLESIRKFKDEVLKEEKVDLLLNIAGIAFLPSQDTLTTSTPEILSKTFAVNTFGPFFVTQTLLPNLLASSEPKLAIVTSRVGSMGDNSSGGSYAYRASKAAANSLGKSMAVDLKEKGVAVMLLHPGYVRTGLLPDSEVPEGVEVVEPEKAAGDLWRNVVTKKGIEDSGRFWHREGWELPW